MLFARTFKIRLDENYRDKDESLLNDFLESVIPKKIDSAIIHHPIEAYWSVLVIYMPREDVAIADGEQVLFDTYEPLSQKEELLFMKLKLWRDKEAEKEELPSHQVLHDAHLMTLAKIRPLSEQDFKKIKGISKRKLEKYMDAILSFFRKETKR